LPYVSPAAPGPYDADMPPQRRQRPAGHDESAAAVLSGTGPSQLGISGSMRARDVSRPTDDDVAEAERLVQVSYRPRSRPHPGRQDGSAPR